MPITLGADGRIELRWWWEDASPGAPLRLRDASAVRACLAQVRGRPEQAAALRRFLHQGAPGAARPLEDGQALDQAVAAVVSGLLRMAELRLDRLSTWGELDEEVPVAPVVQSPVQETPAEEVCWPCLRAAASARALREAAACGAPLIAEL